MKVVVIFDDTLFQVDPGEAAVRSRGRAASKDGRQGAAPLPAELLGCGQEAGSAHLRGKHDSERGASLSQEDAPHSAGSLVPGVLDPAGRQQEPVHALVHAVSFSAIVRVEPCIGSGIGSSGGSLLDPFHERAHALFSPASAIAVLGFFVRFESGGGGGDAVGRGGGGGGDLSPDRHGKAAHAVVRGRRRRRRRRRRTRCRRG